MENGLEIVSKKFEQIKNIRLLEFINSDEKLLVIGEDSENKLKFIIWDIYHTGKVKTITLDDYPTIDSLDSFGTCFARTSGNLLTVDAKGNVTSILKKVESKLKQIQPEAENDLIEYSDKKQGNKLDGKLDKQHIIHFDKSINPSFETIIDDVEPWVMDDYKRNSYYLYQDKKRTETLQL